MMNKYAKRWIIRIPKRFGDVDLVAAYTGSEIVKLEVISDRRTMIPKRLAPRFRKRGARMEMVNGVLVIYPVGVRLPKTLFRGSWGRCMVCGFPVPTL